MTIHLYIGNTLISTNAIYSECKITKERESGEMFKRTSMSAKYTFLNEDFDTIYDGSLDTEYRLEAKEGNTLIGVATFHKMDCTFDVDNRVCVVEAKTIDEYEKIVNGLDDEYDLVSLAPVREGIGLKKRPVIQYYILGDNKVTNVIGNTSFEVDTNMVLTHEDVDTQGEQGTNYYGFTRLSDWEKMNISFDEGTIEKTRFPDAEGVYWKTKIATDRWRFTNSKGYYFEKTPAAAIAGLFDKDNNLLVPASNTFIGISLVYAEGYTDSADIYRREDTSHGDPVAKVGTSTIVSMYLEARIIHDKADSGYAEDMLIPTEDIVANNLNYHYITKTSRFVFSGGRHLEDYTIASTETSETPTKYMQNSDGEYFVEPTEWEGQPISEGVNVIPVGWNQWIPASFWLIGEASVFSALDFGLAVPWTLNDAYPLWSAISVLLGKIDPSITFEGTDLYSEFLYGTNPLDNLAHRLYISPITNVKRTYYNDPAKKGKITLGQIFDMLKGLQCYWFIDGGKLRIEHISWFKNGGAYTSQNPLIDLTSLYAPKLGKAWSWGANTIKYDKGALPKRYEFAWSDDCTEPFNGEAIDIHNGYVTGSTLKTTMTNFVSDIDCVMSAPSMMSDDCFALIDTIGGVCPIATFGLTTLYVLQNVYLSFLYIAKTFWINDLSGDDATIGGYVLSVADTKRTRIQSVSFPLDAMLGEGLIKTDIGNGEWTAMEWDVINDSATCELLFDTL